MSPLRRSSCEPAAVGWPKSPPRRRLGPELVDRIGGAIDADGWAAVHGWRAARPPTVQAEPIEAHAVEVVFGPGSAPQDARHVDELEAAGPS